VEKPERRKVYLHAENIYNFNLDHHDYHLSHFPRDIRQHTIIMLGLRNLARNAPRSAARLSTKAVRPQSSVFRQTAAFQPTWAAVPRLTAAFHVSARRQESGAGKRN
jgi:hypothetical protein